MGFSSHDVLWRIHPAPVVFSAAVPLTIAPGRAHKTDHNLHRACAGLRDGSKVRSCNLTCLAVFCLAAICCKIYLDNACDRFICEKSGSFAQSARLRRTRPCTCISEVFTQFPQAQNWRGPGPFDSKSLDGLASQLGVYAKQVAFVQTTVLQQLGWLLDGIGRKRVCEANASSYMMNYCRKGKLF